MSVNKEQENLTSYKYRLDNPNIIFVNDSWLEPDINNANTFKTFQNDQVGLSHIFSFF